MKTKLILVSLLALSAYWNGSIEDKLALQQKLLEEQQSTLDWGKELADDQTDMISNQLNYLLSDDAKARFRPLQFLVARTNSLIDEQIKLADRLKKSIQLKKSSTEDIYELQELLLGVHHDKSARIDECIYNSLKSMSKDFGLTEEQLKSVYQSFKIKERTDRIATLLHLINTNYPAESIYKINLAITEYTFLKHEITSLLASLSGGRMLSCFAMPISVYTSTTAKKIGDPIELFVVLPIGNLERAWVKVNGKQLRFDDNGVARYSGFYNEGKPYVIVSFEVTNILTGEVMDGKWEQTIVKEEEKV